MTEQGLIIGGGLQAKNFVLVIIILFAVCKERGRQHIHFFSAY